MATPAVMAGDLRDCGCCGSGSGSGGGSPGGPVLPAVCDVDAMGIPDRVYAVFSDGDGSCGCLDGSVFPLDRQYQAPYQFSWYNFADPANGQGGRGGHFAACPPVQQVSPPPPASGPPYGVGAAIVAMLCASHATGGGYSLVFAQMYQNNPNCYAHAPQPPEHLPPGADPGDPRAYLEILSLRPFLAVGTLTFDAADPALNGGPNCCGGFVTVTVSEDAP